MATSIISQGVARRLSEGTTEGETRVRQGRKGFWGFKEANSARILDLF
jgi:hypothetical protein